MKTKIKDAIQAALASEFDVQETIPFSVEEPKSGSHGDLATNVAMLLTKKLKKPPREIASLLATSLAKCADVEKVEIAGPGFINLFIKNDSWHAIVKEVLQSGDDYGRSITANPTRVLVEFVSANPTGPLHFGHGRGAVVGDVSANLLAFSGSQVAREFYVNDAGKQVQNLALSVVWWLRKEQGQESTFPEDGYRGDYVQQLAHIVPDDLKTFLPNEPSPEELSKIEHFAVATMLVQIKQDLHDFGVHMDRYSSERDLLTSQRLAETFEQLEKVGAVEKRDGATWFLSDRFGDEKPRVLVKSDGSNTYFATDVAYHLDKLRRGFHVLVNIWGADHHGYVARVKAALEAFGHPRDALDVVLVQMVSLVRDKKPVVLSKRSGDIITLRQVYEEVGRDAARFFFLIRSADSQMEFDLALAKKKSLDNPVYYVQYGHARLSQLLARARQRKIDLPDLTQLGELDLSALVLSEEIGLIKKMGQFGEVIQRAAQKRLPHLLVYYLQELIGDFHSYYTKYGKSDPILKGDPSKIYARLVLVLALRQVLRNALALLGVSAPNVMESLGEQEQAS